MNLKETVFFAGGSRSNGRRIGHPLVPASRAEARAIDDDIERALATIGADDEALSERSARLEGRTSLIDLDWIARLAAEEAQRAHAGAR
jgi:hypothetical protein